MSQKLDILSGKEKNGVMMFYGIWKDKAMKTNSFSGVNFLIVGLVLFLVGLLMILHQAAVVGFFSLDSSRRSSN